MTRDDLPDDELMTRFSGVLHDEARGYEPASDSLARIQQRTSAPRGRTAWRWAAPLAAAAVVVGVASAMVLLPDGDQTAGLLPGGSLTPSASVSPTGPAPSPSASSSEPTECLGGPLRVPVYYLGQDSPNSPGALRLYREFHLIGTCDAGDNISSAVTTLLSEAPADPDYTTGWPADTRLLSVQVSGDTATVDLSRFTIAGAFGEQRAVEQLVWTVTAADPSVKQVKLRVNGAVPPSGHSDWSQPQRRGSSLETLANVWILTPTQDAEVGSPVTVTVYGTGFEGNVPIKVFRNGTQVAATQVTTAMGGFAQAKTTLDLPPGTYEVRAYNDNGKDATLALWDTKTFTVS